MKSTYDKVAYTARCPRPNSASSNLSIFSERYASCKKKQTTNIKQIL
jgi:hypothetical protein